MRYRVSVAVSAVPEGELVAVGLAELARADFSICAGALAGDADATALCCALPLGTDPKKTKVKAQIVNVLIVNLLREVCVGLENFLIVIPLLLLEKSVAVAFWETTVGQDAHLLRQYTHLNEASVYSTFKQNSTLA
jgi:hypothetical protein